MNLKQHEICLAKSIYRFKCVLFVRANFLNMHELSFFFFFFVAKANVRTDRFSPKF